jgi:hypothetical protein
MWSVVCTSLLVLAIVVTMNNMTSQGLGRTLEKGRFRFVPTSSKQQSSSAARANSRGNRTITSTSGCAAFSATASAFFESILLPELHKRAPGVDLTTALRGTNVAMCIPSYIRHSAPAAPPRQPVSAHLWRVVCKLAMQQPVIVVAVGGSNTDGRYKPFYTNELEDMLNAVFPVNVTSNTTRSRHTVVKLGRGGWGSAGWASRAGFEDVRAALHTLQGDADLLLLETEPNDDPLFTNTWGVPKLPPAWADTGATSRFHRNGTYSSVRFPNGLNFYSLACIEAVLLMARHTVPDVSLALLGVSVARVVRDNCGKSSAKVDPAAPSDSGSASANLTARADYAPVQCALVHETIGAGTTKWPMVDGPDCNELAKSASGLLPASWCATGRWSRPLEDCIGVPSVSISDALRPVAHSRAFAAQLSPRLCHPESSTSSPPKPRIYSFDSSGHTGGQGNSIVAGLVVAMLAQAMASLNIIDGPSANLICAAKQPPPEFPAHYITESELHRLKTTATLQWRHVDAGDGWCYCNSPWPAVCPHGGAWVHAAQGRHKKWCDKERAMRKPAGHNNLSWSVTLPADHSSSRISLEFIKSSFGAYGQFVVSVTPALESGSSDNRSTSVVLDGRAEEHTVSAREMVAAGLGSSAAPGREWRFTVTPLPKDSQHNIGVNATQIVILSRAFTASPEGR